LKGNLAGVFSMDLKHPQRLLFKPLDEPKDLNPGDEKQRWQSIKSVVVISIEDTHG
jgi:hypothetical protein